MEKAQRNILVVEDNLLAAATNRMIFEKLGCQVDHAPDGDKAIEMVKANHYDAISMDIGLPTISGTEVCKAIREYEAKNHFSPVPIVAVTGNNSPEEINEYIKAGMQEVLDKPLTQEKAKHFLSFCK